MFTIRRVAVGVIILAVVGFFILIDYLVTKPTTEVKRTVVPGQTATVTRTAHPTAPRTRPAPAPSTRTVPVPGPPGAPGSIVVVEQPVPGPTTTARTTRPVPGPTRTITRAPTPHPTPTPTPSPTRSCLISLLGLCI